jgi:hypothetical protein
MEHTVNANFADTLTLLGYDLPARRVQPGDSFPVTLHWRAERSIGQNLLVFNHLLDQAAIQHGGADRIPQLYYTTLLWVPSEIVSDTYDVPVNANAPPGVYWLDVGLYPSSQPTFSLPLFENGQPIDRNSVHLGPLKIGGPPPSVTVPEAHLQNPLNLTFGDQITLLGFNFTDSSGNPIRNSEPKAPYGQFTIQSQRPPVGNSQLILFWRADSSPTADYTVFVHLLDHAGNLVAQFDSPPASGAYPTSLWDPGEIIADERSLTDLPPGHYTLQVGLYRSDTSERLAVAGSLDGAVKLAEIKVE